VAAHCLGDREVLPSDGWSVGGVQDLRKELLGLAPGPLQPERAGKTEAEFRAISTRLDCLLAAAPDEGESSGRTPAAQSGQQRCAEATEDS